MSPAPPKTIKSVLKDVTPEFLLQWRRDRLSTRWRKRFEKLSTREIFTEIYLHRMWGAPSNSQQEFFSGSGSETPDVVEPYLVAMQEFLRSLETPPNVVDLGCGDFSVGSRLRGYCSHYIACDIVEPLMAWNRRHYDNVDVEFRVLDMIDEPLPDGDVVFLRQVLQHLSNARILKIVPKLIRSYRYLVLTEHLPAGKSYVENIDKPTGFDTRIERNSGIVLTSPPFLLKCVSQTVVCEVPEYGAVVRTTIYRLR